MRYLFLATLFFSVIAIGDEEPKREWSGASDYLEVQGNFSPNEYKSNQKGTWEAAQKACSDDIACDAVTWNAQDNSYSFKKLASSKGTAWIVTAERTCGGEGVVCWDDCPAGALCEKEFDTTSFEAHVDGTSFLDLGPTFRSPDRAFKSCAEEAQKKKLHFVAMQENCESNGCKYACIATKQDAGWKTAFNMKHLYKHFESDEQAGRRAVLSHREDTTTVDCISCCTNQGVGCASPSPESLLKYGDVSGKNNYERWCSEQSDQRFFSGHLLWCTSNCKKGGESLYSLGLNQGQWDQIAEFITARTSDCTKLKKKISPSLAR